MADPQTRAFGFELRFTETYRENQGCHPAVREAACLQVQLPRLLSPIGEEDVFAGRIQSYPLVGLGLDPATGGPGYYCNDDEIRRRMVSEPVPTVERAQIEEMIDFWREEAGRLRSGLPHDLLAATSNPVAWISGRLTEALVNFDKLIRAGIPGLINEVENGLDRALRGHGDAGLFEGMTTALCLLIDTCHRYGNQARDLAARQSRGTDRRTVLMRMADDLDHLIVSRPETLAQGIQLSWLYTLVSGAVEHGRMDVYLGDLFTRDLDSGRLTGKEALCLLQALWRMIAGRDLAFNSRIMVGGRGRRNPARADQFALAAMEATRTVHEVTPQLCLRVHRGMKPELMAKAREVIGEGRTFPILYNDDVIVPEVARVFDVPEEEAEDYFPYGYGEYALDHRSFGSPSCSLNLLKALEVTLHNGRDPRTGELLGLVQGEFRDFPGFEELFAAFRRQLAHFAGKLARRHVLESEAEGKSVAFLYLSMLYDGCLENGHSILDRGPVYTGGVVEAHGLTHTADSLTAIRQLVYAQGVLTPDELLAALEGGDEQSAARVDLMRAAPKSGHDDPDVDAMVRRVADEAATAVREQAEEVDLDFFLLVHVAGEMRRPERPDGPVERPDPSNCRRRSSGI